MACLIGRVAGVVFSDTASGYHILSVAIAKNSHARISCKGLTPPKALKTVTFQFFGEWETHKKYGRQFVVRSWERFTGSSLRPATALEAAMRSNTD